MQDKHCCHSPSDTGGWRWGGWSYLPFTSLSPICLVPKSIGQRLMAWAKPISLTPQNKHHCPLCHLGQNYARSRHAHSSSPLNPIIFASKLQPWGLPYAWPWSMITAFSTTGSLGGAKRGIYGLDNPKHLLSVVPVTWDSQIWGFPSFPWISGCPWQNFQSDLSCQHYIVAQPGEQEKMFMSPSSTSSSALHCKEDFHLFLTPSPDIEN